jgi:hypothetical protein
MNKLSFLFTALLLDASVQLFAQTLFVDAATGKDVAKGSDGLNIKAGIFKKK